MLSTHAEGILDPYIASESDPFDLAKAGHLLRRVAFGGSLEKRRQLVRGGVEQAVSSLFAPSRGDDVDEVDDLLEDVIALGSVENVRAYRVWRLLRGPHRLRERMSLFWHDHFATSNQKVKSPRMMARQLALFDRLGLGRFDELLLEVSRDPAMVRWLDSESNVRGKANENYARELFELFGLGIGAYTERDIQAAARAFTGWHLRGEQFAFKIRYHDRGEKALFGKRGRFGGEDVISLMVRHPAAAPFLARKLLQFFVHPQPTAAEVEALADVYTRAQRDIGATLGVLLRSRLFFSPRAYRSKIKSPADFVVGTVRSLGATAAPRALAQAMAKMGQAILEPPNVAGWPGERSWLTSSTWLLRSNFSAQLFGGKFKTKIASVLPSGSPEVRANAALDVLLDGDVGDDARRTILGVAKRTKSAADLLHAVQCLPEGQML